MTPPDPHDQFQAGSSSVPDSTSIGGANTAQKEQGEMTLAGPYYSKGFQKSLKLGQQLPKTLWKWLAKSIDWSNDLELNTIREKVVALSLADLNVSRKIGIAGDSGVGKSTLVCSLLGVDVVITGASGESITPFAIEYKQHKDPKAEGFVVQADFFHGKERDDHAKALIESYQRVHHPEYKKKVKAEEEEERRKRAAEQREGKRPPPANGESTWVIDQRESEAAESAMKAGFAHEPNFDLELLRDFSEGGSTRAFGTLNTWLDNIQWPSGAGYGTWEGLADSAEDCRRLIKLFMKKQLWPFVKIMRVYLHSEILQNGLEIIDLPGHRDISFARVKAATDHEANCDELFVVANISRGASDQSVKTIVDRFIESKAKTNGATPHLNIAIVFTHAGDVDVQRAAEEYPEVGKDVIDSLNIKVTEARPLGVETHERAKATLIYTLVAVRNRDVHRKLQAAYAKDFAPLELPLFCIDNKDFQDANFPLDREQTGIPRLRRFCHAVCEKAMFRKAHAYLQHSLPSVFRSLILWRDNNLRNNGGLSASGITVASNLVHNLKCSVKAWRDAFESGIENGILGPIATKKNILNRAAIVETEGLKSRLYWSTIKALCRKRGIHSSRTLKPPLINWNYLLVKRMIPELDWKQLERIVQKKAAAVVKGVHKGIDNIKQVLQEETPKAFLENLDLVKRRVQHIADDETELLLRQIKIIEERASGHHENSYIMTVMYPTWYSCGEDRGEGTLGRCYEMIDEKLHSKTIFPEIEALARKDLEEIIATTVINLESRLQEVCDDIDNDTRAMKNTSDRASKEDQKLRDMLKKEMPGAEASLKEIWEMGAEATEEARKLGFIRDEEVQ